MALMSDVDLPITHVRPEVASAIDLVVHTARLRDGRRFGVHRSDGRATDHPSDTDGTQMDNPLRPAWAGDVRSTTVFLLQRLAGLAKHS
jgi:hypothetical protein